MDGESNDSTGCRSLNGLIMVSSVLLLIAACFIVLLFHAYSRWFIRRRAPRPRRRAAAVIGAGEQDGLDFRAMNSLPTFVYKSKSRDGDGDGEGTLLECAVCLSEFEHGEAGRILPVCKHCFHVDCIDMWLMSHCVCPLCRTHVMIRRVKDPVDPPVENPNEMVLSGFVTGPGPGPNIGCSTMNGSDKTGKIVGA